MVTGLALIAVPVWTIGKINSDQMDSREAWYWLCEEQARALPLPERFVASEKCRDERFTPSAYAPGWKEWREMLFGTLLVCGILYALIWLIVWVVKWVWRGRSPSA